MEPSPEKGPKLRRGLFQLFERSCKYLFVKREGTVVGLGGVVGRCCCCDGLWESGNPPPVRPLSGHQLTAALGGMQKGENAEKDKYEVLRYALDRPQMAYIYKIWSNYLNQM